MLSARRIPAVLLPVLAAGLIAACGSSSSSSSSSSSAGTSSAAAATGTSSAAATSSAGGGCSKSTLALHTPGTLTVATDSPAYPPYFEDNKPSNGKGFESAVAYAIAAKLGFSTSEVKWVTEPFDSSYAPGPKSFDFDINEISITKPREKAVDFSAPYYTNPQGIIVSTDSKYAHVTSLAALRGAKIGVQIGSTSLDATNQVIKPSSQPDVFNTSNDVVSAFKIHRVDAIVVDLATAFELISEIKHSTIAGQFTAPGGDNWGVLLAKGSKLTPCVSQAVNALQSDGTLTALNKRWIASAANVPELH
ncbi:MAG TPA: ABC transporter substrate-binding protein [Solirubrobacteraceae bacterium]|nr:ABC transporter substrate-binding protein [Solirubrobacteraceae bacterium]